MPAGFFIVRPANSSPEPVAPRTRHITLSDCLADVLPSYWTRRSTTMEDAERASKAEAFGYSGDALEHLLDAADRLDESSQCVWPSAFSSLAALRVFLADCPRDAPDALIVAMCLPVTQVDAAIAKLCINDPPGSRALADTLRERHALPPGGRLLGWEVLGEDVQADFHSWHCNDLERELTAPLDLHVNTDGLLPSLEEAEAVAAFCNDPDTGHEPCEYFAFALVEYPRNS